MRLTRSGLIVLLVVGVVIAGWVRRLLRDPGGTLLALLDAVWAWTFPWGPIAAGVFVVACAGRWLWACHCHMRFTAHARVITVLVPPSVDPAGGQTLWSNLVGLLRPAWRRWLFGQPHLVCEYVFSESGVAIRLWVPGVVPPGLVERAVEAAWPGAHTHTGAADPPLPAVGEKQQLLVVGGRLRLAQGEALPICSDFDTDPLRALFGAPVGLGHHEYACVQILARPVTGHRVARARRAARRLHIGRFRRLRWLLSVLTVDSTTRGRWRGRSAMSVGFDDPQTTLEYAVRNRAIVGKQHRPQYDTVIRYAVATVLPEDASRSVVRHARQVARGRAHAIAASFATFTEHNYYRRRRLYRLRAALTGRRLTRGDLLSVPELAGLAHLPIDESIPGVRRAGARAIAPPPEVAVPGPDAKPLGESDSGRQRPVALRVSDARHHVHVIGATGSGKSTLLARMILADADAGRGVVVIDPKGDLVTDVLARLPRSAADRVALFDADSRSRPPCLNPFDGDDDPDRAVDNLVSVFRRVFAAFWGPRTDDVMRAACLTLRTQPAVATLADLPTLLSDPAFRSRITAGVTDPILRGFWRWYDDLTDSARSQVIAPLLNKLRAILLRPFVRDALAAGSSTVDMRSVLDGGICLVRIPKGSLGDETTRLLGSLVVARAWQATAARAALAPQQRRDASLVIDECHNFLNLPFPIEDMLTEARGFRLSLMLAHQYLGQLPRELREGISTNARSKIMFTASPEDARDLARYTTPRLTDHDLAHLGVYHAATRLVLHSAHAEPFTIRTLPLPPAIPGRAREIRRRAARQARPHTPGGPTRPNPTTSGSRSRSADPRRHL